MVSAVRGGASRRRRDAKGEEARRWRLRLEDASLGRASRVGRPFKASQPSRPSILLHIGPLQVRPPLLIPFLSP